MLDLASTGGVAAGCGPPFDGPVIVAYGAGADSTAMLIGLTTTCGHGTQMIMAGTSRQTGLTTGP